MRRLLILPALMAMVSTGCGHPDDQAHSDLKILRGELVKDSQNDERRRSTVALTTDTKSKRGVLLDLKKSFCTGTIISKTVIVTAAHCLQTMEGRSGKKGGLIFGKDENYLISFDTQVNRDGTWIRAKKVIPHPDWDPAATLNPMGSTAPHDIGLVILSEEIPQGARPAKIADANLDLESDEKSFLWFKKKTPIYLAGYGVTKRRSKPDTGTLRQVTVKLSKVNKQKKQIKVGKFLKGACAGDSGGPAYVKVGNELQLAGATSTGIELLGNCVGIVNNYTDVRQYTDWIQKTVESLD